ncbi:MAG: methyltransferase domain-containing protein [Planctomycetaceae bacterium]|nr:methyltransferase domain-containing protein [Planctomycetales bacterium]MCB9927563.1 methyltransferase domain-containing protein [Planctomycetaceae bacterium]
MTKSTSESDLLRNALDDSVDLVRRLVSVTDITTEEVIRRLQKENRELGVNVREDFDHRGLPRYKWTAEMSDFYNDTNAFLFETIVWNRTLAKHRIREWIGRFLKQHISGPARILTFGDGLGFDSLYLALAGHNVEYLEVSQTGIQFATGLFEDHDVDVKILTANEQVQSEGYDAVVCLDVLEHIPKPTDVVGDLSAAIRNQGYLLVHAPFWYIGPSVVTHLRENRRFSGDVRRLYRPHGLHPVDGNWAMNPMALQKTNTKESQLGSHFQRLRLAVSRHILWYGRFWSAPYNIVAAQLTKPTSWPQLEALQVSGVRASDLPRSHSHVD